METKADGPRVGIWESSVLISELNWEEKKVMNSSSLGEFSGEVRARVTREDGHVEVMYEMWLQISVEGVFVKRRREMGVTVRKD